MRRKVTGFAGMEGRALTSRSSFRGPRSGNPESRMRAPSLDSRLRGNDEAALTALALSVTGRRRIISAMHRWMRPLLVVQLLVLAACTVNPATGQQSFTAFMSADDERRIGAEEHPKMIREFGGAYGDAKLRAYIHRVGNRLAQVSELADQKFTFTVLNDDKVNAFALPGGYVYITRGLIALAGNEAEMAGVLAHEIGHVTARHSAQRYSTAMATNLGLMVLDVIGSQAGIPSSVGQLVGFGAQAALMGYSRDQELESDQLAVRYLARAGYDPRAMTTFFFKMEAHAELERAMLGKPEGPTNNIMSTHPRTGERIQQAVVLARLPAGSPAVLGGDEFLAEIDGMVFGDDPDQGVRRGNEFVHPSLGFRFQVPPGFTLFNAPQRVVARGPKQSLIIFDMADQKTARQSGRMLPYLTGVWGSRLALRGAEALDINGMEAATAEARLNTRDGPKDVRLIAARAAPERIFRFAFITPPEMTRALNEDLRRTTYSLRRLDAAEAKSVRPLRIKLRTVQPGDTVESLAAAIPSAQFRRRWFEVLNGLAPGQPPTVGQVVKTVE